MYPDLSLKEKVTHGTPRNPIHALHFTTGEGTPFPDHFFVSRHWHGYVEILYILKGNYQFEINLENHYLSQGDIFVTNKEITYGNMVKVWFQTDSGDVIQGYVAWNENTAGYYECIG